MVFVINQPIFLALWLFVDLAPLPSWIRFLRFWFRRSAGAAGFGTNSVSVSSFVSIDIGCERRTSTWRFMTRSVWRVQSRRVDARSTITLSWFSNFAFRCAVVSGTAAKREAVDAALQAAAPPSER